MLRLLLIQGIFVNPIKLGKPVQFTRDNEVMVSLIAERLLRLASWGKVVRRILPFTACKFSRPVNPENPLFSLKFRSPSIKVNPESPIRLESAGFLEIFSDPDIVDKFCRPEKERKEGLPVTIIEPIDEICSKPVQVLNFGFLSMMSELAMEYREVNPLKEFNSGHAETWKASPILVNLERKDRSLFGILKSVKDPSTTSRLEKYLP
jgi:hypothetical protein